jgi:hypothetical protein
MIKINSSNQAIHGHKFSPTNQLYKHHSITSIINSLKTKHNIFQSQLNADQLTD